MFIHLGGDTVIRSKDVIAILDGQSKDSSSISKEFLQQYETDNSVITISKELSKSIVITTDAIYLSPISSITLKRRAHVVTEFDSYTD
ncbi:extracellular matrix regulator RemB [Anaerobacillus sp. MEB173]|uniref:extracellular matrix regulator RemB n=1 Tax=Anaerobacillus sp. MEB173 TaxID=3383345 RepID=UPI003F8DE0EF